MSASWLPELVSGLCQTEEGNPFPVWQDGNISPCFNQLVLGALPHAGMAVLSACYLGMPRWQLHTSPPCGWTLRLVTALLVVVLFVIDLSLVGALQQPDMYLDILMDSCGVLAWMVHGSAIAVLMKTRFRRTRGPQLLLITTLLLVPNLVINLVICCNRHDCLSLTEPFKLMRFVLASARMLLLLGYLLAFAFPCISNADYTLYINAVDGSPLLPEDVQLDTGEIVAEDGSSYLSRLFYLWLDPLLRRGQRGELTRPTHVYHLPQKLQTSAVFQHFHHCWGACRRGTGVDDQQDSRSRWDDGSLPKGSGHEEVLELEGDVRLLRVLHKAFGLRYYILGVLKVMVNMSSFAGPLLLSRLVNFIEDTKAPVTEGVWCVLGLFGMTLFSSVLQNIFAFEVSKVCLSARASLVSAVYGKALRVSSCSLAGFSLGEVVNLMSTDTDRVVNFFNSFHELWSLPFRFSITLYLLYLQVGVAFLGGLCVALVLVPLNKFLASRILSNNKHMLKCKDDRVKLMTEILFGIRVIKFYNWEPHFTQKVSEHRKQELSYLRAIKYLDALCVYTWAALPVIISILTFVTYVLLGHQLTAAKVFTTVALVGMLIVPLNAFPWVLSGILEAKVSLERIQRFIGLTNQDLLAHYALSRRLHLSLSLPYTNISDGFCLVQGSLVVVVGKVGCGKSSLLAALTGELRRLSGVLYVANREAGFGLVSQEPWIQHASVQDNILFGKDYDADFYQAVIEACALSDDLGVLPNGDQTEVGENGVTLSGGQKARLALARAAYMNKDIYLLDDPLAAVDTDVAEHLMKKCVMGLLKGKTRILSTHRIEFVQQADMMVLMDNGTIIKTGSSLNLCEEEEELDPLPVLNVGSDPDMLSEEQKQAGQLAWKVYRTYWSAVGGVIAASIVLSPLPAGPAFLSTNMSADVKFYLMVYGSIAVANTVFTALRAFLFAYGVVCAAEAIHNRLLDRVLKATVTFFDTTPLGRILNRFSSDLYTIDDSLPFVLNILLANIFGLLGMLVVMSFGLPWLLAPLLLLALLYHRTQHFYRHTSRELKRLCSLTLSPIYSHFSETITGLGTIRASGSAARFEGENTRRLEQNQRCLFLSSAAMQWLDIRLQMIGVAVVTGLGMIAVIQHQYGSVDPGLVGLSLSYALSITMLLSGLIFSFTQTEMQLVSVERSEEYATGLPSEPQHQNTQVSPAWPERGLLEFCGVDLAYREGLPNALEGVSLVVQPGEKIGIVGRTGSGKSTMFLALFRMVELSQGQILLDHLDISTVGLSQLRSRLAIIPQDPFLFSGTIRENLDPCQRHQDQQLLDVLDQCHLSSVLSRIGELRNTNFFFLLGQRQLLCLARALLTQAKVLCIDEATASVDQKTDQLLQRTIRERFQDHTVLTIAHRINTIMDCDRVLVMHAGKVVEFDTPAALSQTKNSIFHNLVGEQGK
uniref:ATP-binding cassette, sub-family C (CFTR/MRP), member 10 n=1 Tax=Nothobranchius furzeri TaxID=105023 RepID=A0A8C6NTH4_NOTFU